jgi:hypothetical protein
VLQTVIRQDDIQGRAAQQQLGGGNSIRARSDRTTCTLRDQYGLIPELLRQTVCVYVLGPYLIVATVSTRHNADAQAALLEFLR